MKIKLDGKKHSALVKELIEERDVVSVPNYEYRETKVCNWKNGVVTEKVKRCYVLKGSEEDFVQFINGLIASERLTIKTRADFKILKLEVSGKNMSGKNMVAAHISDCASNEVRTIKDFLSAYKFYSS